MFSIFSHRIYNCGAFGYDKKKFDICLLTGWSSTVFILLANIFDHTFNLFINNIVRKPIIDERPVLYFLPLYKILFWRRRLVWHGILYYE